MSNFVPFDKMSKKAQREYLRKHRKPPMPAPKTADDVYRYKQEKRKPSAAGA